jgi:hypothetical protein
MPQQKRKRLTREQALDAMQAPAIGLAAEAAYQAIVTANREGMCFLGKGKMLVMPERGLFIIQDVEDD